MDPKDPTTALDDPAADASTGTTDADPKATGDGTGSDANDSTKPSKSTDANAADGDKKPTAGDTADKDTPALDADLDEWIEKKGLAKPGNDEQRQKYQDFRNDQREFTRGQQAKDDSEKLDDAIKGAKDGLKPAADDDDDTSSETQKRLDALEADRTAERELRLKSEFYTSEKVTTDEHKAIMEIFKEKVDRQPNDAAKLKAVDLWGSPEALPDLLDLAKARIMKGTDTSAVVDQATLDERARIAKESQANSPSGNAKNHNPSEKTAEQERTERLKARYS